MAILAYLGAPRSGKSYSVVENNIIPALKQGRHVVTNIPLEKELLLQVFGGEITQLQKDDVLDPDLPDRIPHGVVLVLDEIWRRWPSGQKVSRASHKDLELLKEHGHKVDKSGKTMQVVLVTQNAADLALWVRDLVKFSFVHEKLDAVGLDQRFTIKIYRGCPTGKSIPDKLKIRESISTYKPEVYQFYKSATQSEADDLNVGDEQVMDKRANIWASGTMIATISFVLLAIPAGLWSLSYFFGMADRAKEAAAAQQPAPGRLQAAPLAPLPTLAAMDAQGKPVTQQSASQPAQSVPVPSPLWRVSGYVKRKTGPDQPAPSEWSSRMGYGVQVAQGEANADNWQEDQAILTSLAGMRTVPLSACVQYPNSVHYYCDLDGERITPWTGQQGLSRTVGAQPLASAKAAVRSEQSEGLSMGHGGEP